MHLLANGSVGEVHPAVFCVQGRPSGFYSGALGKNLLRSFPGVGRMQFVVLVGPGFLFLASCQPGPLSFWRLPTLLVTWSSSVSQHLLTGSSSWFESLIWENPDFKDVILDLPFPIWCDRVTGRPISIHRLCPLRGEGRYREGQGGGGLSVRGLVFGVDRKAVNGLSLLQGVLPFPFYKQVKLHMLLQLFSL